jgi:hypothetical protein
MATMAPEMLGKTPSIGNHADTWAAGIMATRLLTDYFPFDDIIGILSASTELFAHAPRVL